MFHFAGRGGYNATVRERCLLGLLTPQLFQQPLVCHQKFFSPAQTRPLPWESLSKALTLTSCYKAIAATIAMQCQYGCHVQRQSASKFTTVRERLLKMGCREATIWERLLFKCGLWSSVKRQCRHALYLITWLFRVERTGTQLHRFKYRYTYKRPPTHPLASASSRRRDWRPCWLHEQ